MFPRHDGTGGRGEVVRSAAAGRRSPALAPYAGHRGRSSGNDGRRHGAAQRGRDRVIGWGKDAARSRGAVL